MDNTLFYGDNLIILRDFIPSESVDLIYLDPPFNSDQTYNVLFAEKNGTKSSSQIRAFEDTWRWDIKTEETYCDTVERGGRISETLQALRKILGTSDMMAYLTMMAPRISELHRVLKTTGSLYLHCDPTASHYLRILLDSVFGAINFKNEISWKRTSSHNSAKRWGPVHDTIFFYTKTSEYIWNDVYEDYDEDYIKHFYRFSDERGQYRLDNLTGAGKRAGDSGKPWRGIDPTPKNRHWAVPIKILSKELPNEDLSKYTTQEKLDMLDNLGLVHCPEGGVPALKRYLDTTKGTPIRDVINDIQPISTHAAERLGYPTQKPESLLERIISASSHPGDIILDPFCGCGTTITVAEKLKRKWIGIDITFLAISLIKNRLSNTFGEAVQYQTKGEPVSVYDAQELARQDPYQFQWWAVGLVSARPVEQKKGADKGIDGKIFFHDDGSGKTKTIVLSVKAGNTTVSHIRDLVGVVTREQAQIGVLITMEKPTKPMIKEASEAGFYKSEGYNKKYAKIQIVSIEELLQGKTIDSPPPSASFKKAPYSGKKKYIDVGLF